MTSMAGSMCSWLQLGVLVVSFPYFSAHSSCSDCIKKGNNIVNLPSINEKCRAMEHFMKCISKTEEITGYCQNANEVMRVFQKDEAYNDYKCEIDPVVSERKQTWNIRERRDEGFHHPLLAVFGALEDTAENKTSNGTDIQVKKGFIPSITGLYIAMGIWAGVFLSTAVGLTIGCLRLRASKRKEQQSNGE